MVLRRPVKYNPDKRDFVLTEGSLSQLPSKPGLGKFDNQDLFET